MIRKLKLVPIAFILFLIFIIPLREQISAQAASIKLNVKTFTLETNHYRTLSVKGTSKKVIWSSADKKIVTVTSNGKVMAKATGTATIYANVGGIRLNSKVTVIKLSSSSAVIAVGGSKTLRIYGTSSKVTWSSSNIGLATISSSGKITAKGVGKVTIYANVLGKKLSCKITVSKPTNVPLNRPTSAPTTVPTKTPTKIPTPTHILSVTPTPTITPIVTPVPMLSKKIIGYYAAWSRYSGFTPDKIDANKLTHINYAFANIGSDLKIQLGYPDVDPSNINGLNKLKQQNPKLKTIISVGGYSWSGKFSDVALTESSRTIFANSCVDFIDYYGFDGIDLDWEYPVSGGLPGNVRRAADKQNFTLLMKTLRERLNAKEIITGKKYILTFAGAAGTWYLNNIELNLLNQYIDYANVMTYDLHGTWESYTNFNAPLYSDDPLRPNNISVDKSIKEWMKTGFPKNKIVMGVPFYGYIYHTVSNVNNGFNQLYSTGASITYQKVITNFLNTPGYNYYYNSYAKVPWLFDGSTFITYENELSMSEKAQYIKNNDLSGVMIWELSQDPNKVLLNSLYQKLIQ